MSLLIPRRREGQPIEGYSFWCPGCKRAHFLAVTSVVGAGPQWHFNGNMAAPSFQPSLLHYGETRCHLNVVNGHLQFLADSTHELAGKTVPMVDWDTINEAKSA